MKNLLDLLSTSTARIIAMIAGALIYASGFAQSWQKLNDIGASTTGSASSVPAIGEALTLSTNGKIYVAGSLTYSGSLGVVSVWEYDSALDKWKEKSVYPGTGTANLCGFAIGHMLYMGCGSSGSVLATSDFYKYNTITNVWAPITNIPAGRLWGGGFSIGAKGYITGGEGNTMSQYLGDLWAYDTTANTWTKRANFPGQARALPSAFGTKDAGYVGLGFMSGTWFSDLYRYDPVANSWLTMDAPPFGGRCASGVAVTDNLATFVCGNYAMNVYSDCYTYNISTGSWSGFFSFGGSSRSSVLCGSVGNKVFAGGGTGPGGNPAFRDWWTMGTTAGITSRELTDADLSIYKDVSQHYVLKSEKLAQENCRFTITDLQSKVIYRDYVEPGGTKLPEIPSGVYCVVFDPPLATPRKICIER
jgi:N-acetylneuraminic acid mutarotase